MQGITMYFIGGPLDATKQLSDKSAGTSEYFHDYPVDSRLGSRPGSSVFVINKSEVYAIARARYTLLNPMIVVPVGKDENGNTAYRNACTYLYKGDAE